MHLLQIAIDTGAMFHVARHTWLRSWRRPSKIKGLRASFDEGGRLYRSANKAALHAGNL
jgi:hypothetical protein